MHQSLRFLDLILIFTPFFLKKPGSSETPPQITKKATNTALGIAAMAASFAPNSNSNTPNQNQQSTSATSKGGLNFRWHF